MSRLIFEPGELHNFIASARKELPLLREELARKLGISGRTLADWQREKYLPDQEKLELLSKISKIPLPTPKEKRVDWWSGQVNGRAGSLACIKKYGCTFTYKQQVMGGHISQIKRKENPEFYKALGCPIPRSFIFPKSNSNQLAEFVGILLGDGCIRSNQVSITLNSIADKQYIQYVKQLIIDLFQYTPTIHDRFPTKATTILISGVDFVNNLIFRGMKIGNKVKQQVDVPEWIKNNSNLSRWCLRGLMDTDGGIFTHTYIVNSKSYSYLKSNFTNASQPLLDFVYNTLLNNGFHPHNNTPRKVWLYSQDESKRYLHIFGSSNQRLLKKIR